MPQETRLVRRCRLAVWAGAAAIPMAGHAAERLWTWPPKTVLGCCRRISEELRAVESPQIDDRRSPRGEAKAESDLTEEEHRSGQAGRACPSARLAAKLRGDFTRRLGACRSRRRSRALLGASAAAGWLRSPRRTPFCPELGARFAGWMALVDAVCRVGAALRLGPPRPLIPVSGSAPV